MSSLDDFFAKKDKRKKGKSKQNFVTSELLVKTIEEQSAPSTQLAESDSKAKIDLPAAPTQEDEWKEEEEIVKDFEGLRVQKLDKEDDDQSEKEPVAAVVQENVEEGEGAVKEATSGSPWQTLPSTQPDVQPSAEADSEPDVPEKLPNVQGDVYVPPGARGGGGGGAREGGAYVPPHLKRAAGGGGTYVPPGRRGGGGARGKRVPPDLKSNLAFPSLADMAKKGEGSAADSGGGDFKEAQGPKTSRATEANYRAPTLELTNKFSGLEDD